MEGKTITLTPGDLAEIAACFDIMKDYAAMCAEIEEAGYSDYETADEIRADAGEQAVQILESLFPDLVTWREARAETER